MSFSLNNENIHGWITDDLQFSGPFNRISVISRRWAVLVNSCMQWNPVYVEKEFRLRKELNKDCYL